MDKVSRGETKAISGYGKRAVLLCAEAIQQRIRVHSNGNQRLSEWHVGRDASSLLEVKINHLGDLAVRGGYPLVAGGGSA